MLNTVSRSRNRIGRYKVEEKLRNFIITFTHFFQQICRLQNELFDRDINLAIVAGAIAVANIEARMRERNFRNQFSNITAAIGTDLQRGCNALSVAEATGLARETVRRRINRLVEMGIVLRRGPGDYVLQPGVLQKQPFVALFHSLSNETLRLVNECLDEEIYTVMEAHDG